MKNIFKKKQDFLPQINTDYSEKICVNLRICGDFISSELLNMFTIL